MKENNQVPKAGMNRDSHPMGVQANEYISALNANIQDETGNGVIMLQNEHSNILCSRFGEGMKVIGLKHSASKNRTYFFLTDPETGRSVIGFIKDKIEVSFSTDVESDCGCTAINILDAPLEDTDQLPTCTFETLVDDECNNCLNFSLNKPIKDGNIVIKEEQCGETLYWTDSYNPPRYLSVESIEKYLKTGEASCGYIPEDTCLDCDKLRMWAQKESPCISFSSITTGNLKEGVYEALIARCDAMGRELSQYYSITNPVRIFDARDIIKEQKELAEHTTKGIDFAVNITGDGFYKVAIIMRADINQATDPFILGVYPNATKIVTLSTDESKERTDLTHLAVVKPTYLTTDGMTESGGILFQYGVKAQHDINLQPIANLLGLFLGYTVNVADEEIYKNDHTASQYVGYMRGEVYPFAIRFNAKGYTSPVFNLNNRPPKLTDLEIIDNLDTTSINSVPNCTTAKREKRWEIYDTSEYIASCPLSTSIPTEQRTIMKELSCVVADVAVADIQTTVATNNLEGSVTNLMNENASLFCDNTSSFYDASICALFDPNSYTEQCSPGGRGCTLGNLLERKVVLFSAESETVHYNLDTDFSSYPFIDSPTEDTMLVNFKDADGNWVYENQVPLFSEIMKRAAKNTHNEYNKAIELTELADFDDQIYAPVYFSGYERSTAKSTLLTAIPQAPNLPVHEDKVTVEASWFKVNFNGKDRILIDITKDVQHGDLDEDWDSFYGNRVISTYDDTGSIPTAYVTSNSYSINNSIFLFLDRINYSSDSVLLSIDYGLAHLTGTNPTEEWAALPSHGGYKIALRRIGYSSVDVDIKGASFDLVSKYEATCVYDIPTDNLPCKVTTIARGRLGYWESRETYPDNKELFDSSGLKIKVSDFSNEESAHLFEDSYVESIGTDGSYELNNFTDFTCSAIRHYKMPENYSIPFMTEGYNREFFSARINILGVHLDAQVVSDFLDIAVQNRLITKEFRDSIDSYEILRGDRRISKSILAKGLMYDVRSFQEKDRDLVHYSNYPYNDLGVDLTLLDRDTPSALPIKDKHRGLSNDKFTFDSPDTIYYDFEVPEEVYIEGYSYGRSRGRFADVEEHAKWVILSKKGHQTAIALGVAEQVLTTLIQITDFALQALYGGWSTALVGGAFVIAPILALGLDAALSSQKLINKWKLILIDLGQPENHAKFYSSIGWHNFFIPNDDEGNMLRGMSYANRIRKGMWRVRNNSGATTINLNHKNREETVMLVSNEELTYPSEYVNYDNSSFAPSDSSRFYKSLTGECMKDIEHTRNIASPYASLRLYRPSQYGTLDNIEWLTTGKCIPMDSEDCLSVYGGDTFISRYSMKRKFEYFTVNAIGQSEDTAFRYSRYPNIAHPRFFMDAKYYPEHFLLPRIGDTYELDCEASKPDSKLYLDSQSSFYLYSYGIPSMLVESTINLNYRYARKSNWELFYPISGDYVDWTQEVRTSIREDNTLFYNSVYSREVTRTTQFTLPSTYSKEFYDCTFDLPNGGIYSDIDNSEVDITDPFLSYRALNMFRFNSSYGKLIDLRGIGSKQVLGRFENQAVLFNAVERRKDTIYTQEIGNGSIFDVLPTEFFNDEVGFSGTQHKAFLATKGGNFWVDAKRGEVYSVSRTGSGLSSIVGSMRNWFREHLPFKILKSKLVDGEVDIDNNFSLIGVALGYDNRYDRIFVTKRDLIPEAPMVTVDGVLVLKSDYDDKVKHFLATNSGYKLVGQNGRAEVEFEHEVTLEIKALSFANYILPEESYTDASFTVGYSLMTNKWLSYYSFKPNYYINKSMYFQTGINFSKEHEDGLWSHLLTNKSFQVFYGKLYPFRIEAPVVNTLGHLRLDSFKYLVDVRRYHNEYDYATSHKVGFNYLTIYNHSSNTGRMAIETSEVNSLRDRIRFPKVYDNHSTIKASRTYDAWAVNGFYDRVINTDNNRPIFNWGINAIDKTIDYSTLRHRGIQERMRGDWFVYILEQTKESRYKFTYKWSIGKTTVTRE